MRALESRANPSRCRIEVLRDCLSLSIDDGWAGSDDEGGHVEKALEERPPNALPHCIFETLNYKMFPDVS